MATKPTKMLIRAPKRRDPIARDLLTPKYRQRVEPNRKRDAKSLIPKEFFRA
jgi:hypothetical protein